MFNDLTQAGLAFALAFAALKVVSEALKLVWGRLVYKNGNGKIHPYEESRVAAKLTTLCTLAQENLNEQRRANESLSQLCAHRDVEHERHISITASLSRIESEVKR